MLYDLIQIRRGKSKIVMTDQLTKVNDRKRTLSKGHRGGIRGEKVQYSVVPSSVTEKMKEKPHDRVW